MVSKKTSRILTFWEVSLTTGAMSLSPPPPNVHGRYVRLLAMAERGTKHEAVVAEMKLASLRGRYDFSVSPAAATTDPEDDLFSNAARIRPDQKIRRRLIVFDMEDAPIGNYVKWVLQNGFQIDGVWRATARGKATALYVGAKNEDLPALRNVAEIVSDRFKNLWRRFCETTGADSNDEPGFYAGLYDGLMGETRKAGKAIPARNRSAKKSRRKAPVKSAETNVRPHVYSIALELGAEIRLNRPLERITLLLDDLLDTH
ncbi:MAG TPA: hypothetical protein VE860_05500 [Chthoniobacterales bacterium]|nr:hypothetical protein [Chthoniobacterales bacterium]